MLKRIIAGVAVAVTLASAAVAVELNEQGRFSEAAKLYRLGADQGFAFAQFNLGSMHQMGVGAPLDYPEAAKWFRLAADQGFAFAQFNLGLMYAKGQGVPLATCLRTSGLTFPLRMVMGMRSKIGIS